MVVIGTRKHFEGTNMCKLFIEDMHNFAYPKNRYKFISEKAQQWTASRPQAKITRKQRDNEDVSTSGVATTGKVAILKIWKESP